MKVNVDVNDIKDNRTKMLAKVEDIIKDIDEINRKIEESKDIFDTPAATVFRDSANEYIFESKNYINNSLIPIINSLSSIAQVYENLQTNLDKSTNA